MSTLTVTLPDSLKAFVDERAKAEGYVSADDYVRALIQHRQDVEKLRALIQEGLDSPIVEEEVDEAFFERIEAEVRASLKK